MTPLEQARAFGAMLCCGLCMGVLYDFLGPIRRVRGLCTMTDLTFGVCCAAGMIWTALRLQVDAFRLYAFAGAGCGLVLYGLTVGKMIRRIASAVRRNAAKGEENRKNMLGMAGN